MNGNTKPTRPKPVKKFTPGVSYQSAFPKIDINRRASSDSDEAFLSDNTRFGLLQVYERLYCSRKELDPLLLHANRLSAVEEKMKRWKTQECHSAQVRQRVEEMSRRRLSLAYRSCPPCLIRIPDEKEDIGNVPIVRTSSPVGKRADNIRRRWRQETSFERGSLTDCCLIKKPLESFESQKQMVHSGGDCRRNYPLPETIAKKPVHSVGGCDRQGRVRHPDELFGDGSRLEAVAAAQFPPRVHLHRLSKPTQTPGVSGDDPLKVDLLKYPVTCPPQVDSRTFYERGVDPQNVVVLPHLAAPMSPIDIYYSLEEDKNMVPPPLFHPAAFKTQLHRRHLALYQDPLPSENLEDHTTIKRLLSCRDRCEFRAEPPVPKRPWFAKELAYPIPCNYKIGSDQNYREIILLRTKYLSETSFEGTDEGT